MAFEHLDLFAGPAKDHRIAGLEADHMLALASQGQHHLVDIFLAAAFPRGALADQHALGLAPGQFKHIR
ncbi:hypothetical protein D3C87_2086560 [compost metagenome]